MSKQFMDIWIVSWFYANGNIKNVFGLYLQEKLFPLESSQPLKKVEEEQESDEEDVSEEEAENKEGTNTDFSQNAIRQRSVGPSLATDKS